jgi:hypothetical protein
MKFVDEAFIDISAGDGGNGCVSFRHEKYKEFGGLTAFVYSTDDDFVAQAEQAYARAGAQLTINLTGAMPLNFAAAYSDFHVTGLNPAGNAALTHLAFVANRFCVSQSRRPARSDQQPPIQT